MASRFIYLEQMLYRILICVLALLPFVACSDGESSNPSGSDGAYDDTPMPYYVHVSFEYNIVPEVVNVTFLDSSFQVIKTVPAKPMGEGYLVDLFVTDPVAVHAAYLRIYMATSNKEMEFSGYAKVDDYSPQLNIYTAAVVGTIEKLMDELSMSYDSAWAEAYARLDDFFGIDNYDYRNRGYNNTGYEFLPYIYCRYFVSDSVFYSDFREMRKAIEAGEWGDTLFRVRAADELVRSFNMMDWDGVRGISINRPFDYVPNFWENAYGMEYCTADRLGDSIANPNRRSDFYDTVFVCDRPHDSTLNVEPHWRTVTDLERKLGMCVYGNERVVEIDSVFYHCGLIDWEETDNMDVVIRNTFAKCDSYRLGDIYEFRNTPYICHSYTYRDTVGIWPGFGYASAYVMGYEWTDSQAVIDSVYPGGIPDTATVEEEEKPWEKL